VEKQKRQDPSRTFRIPCSVFKDPLFHPGNEPSGQTRQYK